MNGDDLLKHTEVAMSLARKDLLDRGNVLPTLIMMPGNSQPHIVTPVPDRKVIPAILRKEKPEGFTWMYEVWIGDSLTSEKRDAIETVGGSGISRILMRQEYHREDGKVVFDKTLTLTDEKLAEHAFTQAMYDPLTGEIMGLWSVAPPGGRLFYARMYGLKIWIPEGWRMVKENAPESGKPRPIFCRDRDANGAVRISTFSRSPGSTSNPIMEARKRAEEAKRKPSVEDVKMEERSTATAVVSWTQVVEAPGQLPVTAHIWWTHDPVGMILLDFTHIPDTTADLADEIGSVEQIVGRLSRL